MAMQWDDTKAMSVFAPHPPAYLASMSNFARALHAVVHCRATDYTGKQADERVGVCLPY